MAGTSDPEVAFKDADVALLVGARPRGPGMERKDLLLENAKIFVAQGKALDKVASRDIKVLVVGNPANTNAYIAMKSAPSLPKKNFTAMLRLDHNRALSQLAAKSGKPVDAIEKLTVWGNHSPTMYPDYRFATVNGQSLKALINDDDWNRNVFLPTVGKRGAAIIEARGLSSAASAANAAIDHVRDWLQGSNGKWVTMGVPSDGSYGIPADVMYGVPVTTANGEYTRVTGLEIDAFSREKMDATLKELEEERAAVASHELMDGSTAPAHDCSALPAGSALGPRTAAARASRVRPLRRAGEIHRTRRSRCKSERGPVFDISTDCEDGAPVGAELAHARAMAALIASDANRFDRVGARVHDVHHPAAIEELAILVGDAGDRLAFLTCPKAESEADVLRFLDRLALETARRGLGREIPVSVMIETHGAVRDAWAIAALPGVVSLDFGTMDFVSAHHGAIPLSAMDSPGQFDHPLLRRAKCETVAAALGACGRAGAWRHARARRRRNRLRRRATGALRVRFSPDVEHPSGADRADPSRDAARGRRNRDRRRGARRRAGRRLGADSCRRRAARSCVVSLLLVGAAAGARRRSDDACAGRCLLRRRAPMTTNSAGAKFRAALAAERPLQVPGAICAYHADPRRAVRVIARSISPAAAWPPDRSACRTSGSATSTTC